MLLRIGILNFLLCCHCAKIQYYWYMMHFQREILSLKPNASSRRNICLRQNEVIVSQTGIQGPHFIQSSHFQLVEQSMALTCEREGHRLSKYQVYDCHSLSKQLIGLSACNHSMTRTVPCFTGGCQSVLGFCLCN